MKFADYQSDAPLHINSYLKAGLESIDELLGKGYAKAHPELLAAYISACAVDVQANVLQDDVGGPLGDLAAPLTAIGDAIAAHE